MVFPLKKEHELVLDWLTANGVDYEKKQSQGKWYTEVPKWQATLVVGGHGKSQYAAQIQYWLDYFTGIEIIIGAGSAGALSKNLKPGDLFGVSEIIEHDYAQNQSGDGERPLFKTQTDQLNLDSYQTSPLIFGRIASGDEDITDGKRASELAEQTKAQAVAWESAGGVKTANTHNIPYAEVRCITDRADKNTFEDFSTNLQKGMNQLCHFFDTIQVRL